MIPDECANIRSIARCVLPVLVGPSTAVTPAPGARSFANPDCGEKAIFFGCFYLGVIASEAKQSIMQQGSLDCFVASLLAMTEGVRLLGSSSTIPADSVSDCDASMKIWGLSLSLGTS